MTDELEALARNRGLLQPGWIDRVRSPETEALWVRDSEVSFMRALGEEERGTVLCAYLRDLCSRLRRADMSQHHILAELSDWQEFDDGNILVPSAGVFVAPRGFSPGKRWHGADSPESQVRAWLVECGGPQGVLWSHRPAAGVVAVRFS